MYLAALVRKKVPLSTYFVATLEGVGGGGCLLKMTFKNFFTNKQTKCSNTNKSKYK